jgi:hypothetical protein
MPISRRDGRLSRARSPARISPGVEKNNRCPIQGSATAGGAFGNADIGNTKSATRPTFVGMSITSIGTPSNTIKPRAPHAWQWSSFEKWVQRGAYEKNWQCQRGGNADPPPDFTKMRGLELE